MPAFVMVQIYLKANLVCLTPKSAIHYIFKYGHNHLNKKDNNKMSRVSQVKADTFYTDYVSYICSSVFSCGISRSNDLWSPIDEKVDNPLPLTNISTLHTYYREFTG